MSTLCSSSTWRPMTPDDLGHVTALAAQIHADYPESPEIFANRLAIAPQGCFILSENTTSVNGYILSHPWQGCLTPRLNTIIKTLPPAPDRWYIHDIVLGEKTRGQGLAGKGIALVENITRRYRLPCISLVSTRHALGFWKKQGFIPEAVSDEERNVLASYDPEASLFSRRVL